MNPLLLVLSLCACPALVIAATTARSTAPVSKEPNILVIYTDDQRLDGLSIMGHPFLKTPNIDRIGQEGAVFSNAFVTTPVCSPSRAGFLSGLLTHAHGVTGNADYTEISQRLNTFPRILQGAGYRTGYFGKWHMGNNGEPRPGFDRWVSFAGQGRYVDPELNIDGRTEQPKGYLADILTEHALAFLNEASEKPFCIVVAHKGPHSPFTPAARHASLFDDQEIERRPNSRDDLSGKPMLSQQLPGWPHVGPGTGPGDDLIKDQLRTLVAIDESVGRIMDALERSGKLDNTFVLFTSDHGYFWGEHGLGDKRAAYDEALRVPLLVRYPPMIPAGTAPRALALNIDVAPTLLSLARLAVPDAMHGKSLLPLLGADRSGDEEFRESFLAEYNQDLTQPRILTWRAIRTQRWKYIQYPTLPDADELYDLSDDPLEMVNLATDPEAVDDLRVAENALAQLLRDTQHPGQTSQVEGVLIDRWQLQNVHDYKDALRRPRTAMLTDGNFNSGFVVLQPNGAVQQIPGVDRERVLAFLKRDPRAIDLRVVAQFYDQGEGHRLVDLSPVFGQSNQTAVEHMDVVAIEAEHAQRSEGFRAVVASEASGGYVMRVDEEVADAGGELEFRFRVETAGRWYVWIRTMARNHRQNGLRLKLNGELLAAPPGHLLAGSTNIFLRRDADGIQWHWEPFWQATAQQHALGLQREGPITVDLAAGDHSLSIVKRLRERPLIDKIVLSRTAHPPEGFGPAGLLVTEAAGDSIRRP